METYHILVVEDDPDINKLLCRILEGAGYQCRPAFSGSEAELWAAQYDYDLILLDLMLPGLSGEEFIAKVRQGKTMPIIVASAKAGLEDRVNVLRLGADDFIPKPFDNAEVLARVQAQLRRYKEFSGTEGSAPRLVHGDLILDRDSVTVSRRTGCESDSPGIRDFGAADGASQEGLYQGTALRAGVGRRVHGGR